MALYHRATITPSKSEMIDSWAPTQPWCPRATESLEVVGAFRFDDPEGKVGMETHLCMVGDTVVSVPLTYREAPLSGADHALIGEMHHSALGTRWVYDGLEDPRYLTMLAAAALTGQGEALGMVEYDGRWHIAPTNVRIEGGGWGLERVAVDHFTLVGGDQTSVVLANGQFEMTVFRQPRPGPRPAMGLAATWQEQAEPVVLATIREGEEGAGEVPA